MFICLFIGEGVFVCFGGREQVELNSRMCI